MCISDGCNRDAISRGLCSHCYGRWYQAVRAGDITWEELVDDGMALPAIGPGVVVQSPYEPPCFVNGWLKLDLRPHCLRQTHIDLLKILPPTLGGDVQA